VLGDAEKSPTVAPLASPYGQPSMKLRLRSGLHGLELTELHDLEVTNLDGCEIDSLNGGLLIGAFCYLVTSTGACSPASSTP
jgi:hypothetical protein